MTLSSPLTVSVTGDYTQTTPIGMEFAPSPRAYASMQCVGDKLFVFGGLLLDDTVNPDKPETKLFSDVFALQLSDNDVPAKRAAIIYNQFATASVISSLPPPLIPRSKPNAYGQLYLRTGIVGGLLNAQDSVNSWYVSKIMAVRGDYIQLRNEGWGDEWLEWFHTLHDAPRMQRIADLTLTSLRTGTTKTVDRSLWKNAPALYWRCAFPPAFSPSYLFSNHWMPLSPTVPDNDASLIPTPVGTVVSSTQPQAATVASSTQAPAPSPSAPATSTVIPAPPPPPGPQFGARKEMKLRKNMEESSETSSSGSSSSSFVPGHQLPVSQVAPLMDSDSEKDSSSGSATGSDSIGLNDVLNRVLNISNKVPLPTSNALPTPLAPTPTPAPPPAPASSTVSSAPTLPGSSGPPLPALSLQVAVNNKAYFPDLEIKVGSTTFVAHKCIMASVSKSVAKKLKITGSDATPTSPAKTTGDKVRP